MRYRLLGIALMLLSTCAFGNGAPALKIEVAPAEAELVLGEDWAFTVTWKNTGDAPLAIAYDTSLSSRLVKVVVQGKTRPECVFLRPPAVDWIPQAHRTIAPRGSLTKILRRDELGIADPGEYALLVEYDATGLGPDWDAVPVERVRVVSNTVRFRLVQPKGADATVFKKHANACNQIVLDQEEILKRYPTSTYAGYVLAQKIPDDSDPLMHPTPPKEQLKQCRDEGKTFVTFPDRSFEEYFQQLDRFMKGGRVPEPLRASLWCFYGDQLVRRGRFPEAQQAFSEAAKGTEPGDPKEKVYWCRAKESIAAFASGDASPNGPGPQEPPKQVPGSPTPAQAPAEKLPEARK